MKQGQNKLNEIENDCRIIEQFQREIDANKNFTYTKKYPKTFEIPLKPGEHVTNCLNCNFTCHYPCYIADNDEKYDCLTMNNGYCTVCEMKCHWTCHKNYRYHLETREVSEPATYENIKKKYGESTAKKQSKEVMLKNAENLYFDIWKKTMATIEE